MATLRGKDRAQGGEGLLGLGTEALGPDGAGFRVSATAPVLAECLGHKPGIALPPLASCHPRDGFL